MDLEQLNSAGMSFLVGAYVIINIEAIAYLLFARHIKGYIDERLPTKVEDDGIKLTTGVVIGLSFAIGLLVEDACYAVRDHFLAWPFRVTYAALHTGDDALSGNDVKTAIQRNAIFDELRPISPRLTSLGGDVCRAQYFKLISKGGVAIHRWACEGKSLPPTTSGLTSYDVVDRTVRAGFYFAKNRVYSVDNYFLNWSE